MQATALKSLFRALTTAAQTKPVAAAAGVRSGAPRELDAAALRQVAGGVTVDLPKRGW